MYFFQPYTLVGAQEEIVNFVSEEKHIGFYSSASNIRKSSQILNDFLKKDVKQKNKKENWH